MCLSGNFVSSLFWSSYYDPSCLWGTFSSLWYDIMVFFMCLYCQQNMLNLYKQQSLFVLCNMINNNHNDHDIFSTKQQLYVDQVSCLKPVLQQNIYRIKICEEHVFMIFYWSNIMNPLWDLQFLVTKLMINLLSTLQILNMESFDGLTSWFNISLKKMLYFLQFH